jgi:NTE family protein
MDPIGWYTGAARPDPARPGMNPRIEPMTPNHEATAADAASQAGGTLGLVLTGGGARAAYQVGVLRWIARRYPRLGVPVLTGVSAGAVNAAALASHVGTFESGVEQLGKLWSRLTPDSVFKTDAGSLLWTAARWAFQLMSGGGRTPEVRAFLNTTPLRAFLHSVLETRDGVLTGVARNIEAGRLRAVAMTATSYSTGQSVVFVQGADIRAWTRPQRRAVRTALTIEHVMASAALPIFFPAIRIGNEWHGDGGVRLTAPLSPALHLGADRILAISTRYDRSQAEADSLQVVGYPPPAQVLGALLNSVFLDLIDQDELRLNRLNQLLLALPPDRRIGLKPIDLLVIRPSVDLGKLAKQLEPQLPKAFRFMTRGLGTRRQKSPDMLSLLMFQPDYLEHLMEIGERDAESRSADIAGFIERVEERGEVSAGQATR